VRQDAVADDEHDHEEQQRLSDDRGEAERRHVTRLDEAEDAREDDHDTDVGQQRAAEQHPGDPRVQQVQVDEDAGLGRQRRRGHRDADEQGLFERRADELADAVPQPERDGEPADRHHQRLGTEFEQVVEVNLHPDVDHQQEDAEFGENVEERRRL